MGRADFSGGRFYLGAMKNHVNMGFSINGLTKEQIGFLKAPVKPYGISRFGHSPDIDEKKIVKLLKIAGECTGDC